MKPKAKVDDPASSPGPGSRQRRERPLDRSGAPRVTEQQDIRDALRDLLLRNDPLNVNYGGGVDAYRPEIERIAQRLPTCRGAEEICSAIHEELCKSFGQAAVGRRGRYLAMAKELRALRTERPG